ncbi:MAG: glycosyltransferase [gamma proteobacterium symbiont of Bathyaustriella thionipta]|nr:glycosyltransferase [gamma proteobacterium symbiont of Bathyaustriella thionipta]MCU7954277.1 glycosyltransferase [gamma proteobacterium symbiont of Bathyaustriella thionipta]MCU7957900.1 glycosyltransferase [gamma proteobacterium symbiont of Bathyaustriella thionipta]MCU7965616.1 glycosyltransferase [gamma proteobacterium symbiont of Bathyaustriella thionipta]
MNPKAPIISVVIPVLNNKNQLAFCLNSILSQPDLSVEIVVIDGGSSDGTLSIIEEYANHIAYSESGQDSGIADAFNRGINNATGEIIAILNSDDYWARNTTRNIIDAYHESPDSDIYYGELRFFNEEPDDSYVIKPDIKKMKYRMNIFHPAMFIKREAYEKVGLYRLDYQYAMDSEWCHRAIKMGLNFHYIPHVLANMRLGGVSDREFKNSLMEYRNSLLESGLTTSIEAWIYYYYFLFMKFLMKIYWLRRLKNRFYRFISGLKN